VGDATHALQDAGFQVTVSPGLGDHVTNYSPTGTAPKGTTITLEVSLFP
jgi:hypothetical protein